MPGVPSLPSHLKGSVKDVVPVSTKQNGRWSFPEQMGLNGHSGFVYVIRDPYLGKFYLGKKFYTKAIRGSTKKVESDWKTYLSSSGTLKKMLEERPVSEFEFIVLEEYKMRGAVSYAETWSLCHVEAPTTSTWYNKRIEEISWNVKENITERHKLRLQKVIDLDIFEE
jgi:hypothetical protein